MFNLGPCVVNLVHEWSMFSVGPFCIHLCCVVIEFSVIKCVAAGVWST